MSLMISGRTIKKYVPFFRRMNTVFIGSPWTTPRNVLTKDVVKVTSPFNTAIAPRRGLT
jgi:hypothetical protein